MLFNFILGYTNENLEKKVKYYQSQNMSKVNEIISLRLDGNVKENLTLIQALDELS